jgi:hypothetical protein
LESEGAVELLGGQIVLGDMKFESRERCLTDAIFDASHEAVTESESSECREDFDGPKVGGVA